MKRRGPGCMFLLREGVEVSLGFCFAMVACQDMGILFSPAEIRDLKFNMWLLIS